MKATLVQFCPSRSTRRRWLLSSFQILTPAVSAVGSDRGPPCEATLSEQLQIPDPLAQEYLLPAAQIDRPAASFRIGGAYLDSVCAPQLLSEAGGSESIYALKHATTQHGGIRSLQLAAAAQPPQAHPAARRSAEGDPQMSLATCAANGDSTCPARFQQRDVTSVARRCWNLQRCRHDDWMLRRRSPNATAYGGAMTRFAPPVVTGRSGKE